MSKFSLFSIFKHSVDDRLKSIISTETKIKEIKRKFKEDTENYVKSVNDSLVLAKRLDAKVKEIKQVRDNLHNEYENLILNGQVSDAKICFIKYKSYCNSYDSLAETQLHNDQEVQKMKSNLEKIRINEASIDAKLFELRTQAETLKYSAGTECITLDCQAMIDELETEIKEKRWKKEANDEIQQIINPSVHETKSVSIDQEFEEEVKRLQR